MKKRPQYCWKAKLRNNPLMYEGSHLNQCFNGEKEESANYAATFKGFTVLEEFM